MDFFLLLGVNYMLFGTMRINSSNHLEIGGRDVSELIKDHGSPLYVYDETHIEDMIDVFQNNFKSELFLARVAYASKAFLTKAMVELLTKKGMSLDCVSGGEMYTASMAGFNMSRTIIHGNNKSKEELHYRRNKQHAKGLAKFNYASFRYI